MYREDLAGQKFKCVHGGCLWTGEPADHQVRMHDSVCIIQILTCHAVTVRLGELAGSFLPNEVVSTVRMVQTKLVRFVRVAPYLHVATFEM